MEMWETVEVWVSEFIELEAVGFPDCGISSSPAVVGKVGGGKLRLKFVNFNL